VVRGGSWNNNPDNARSSARNNNHPNNRNDNIGFRVLCESHINIRLYCRLLVPIDNIPPVEFEKAYHG